MERRLFLTSAAAGAVGLVLGAGSTANTTATSPSAPDLAAAFDPVSRLYPGAFRSQLCRERRRPILPDERV